LAALAIISFTAVLGGFAARLLRQPPLVGFLVGGALVGPHGLGVVHDAGELETAANMGLVLLMFALGAELSLGSLVRMGALPIVAGVLQVVGMAGAWGLLAGPLGWDPVQGALFGYLLALSSTAIVLKLLSERGDLGSIHGQILVGILVFQDVTVVPAMVLLTGLPGHSGDALQLLLVAGATAAKSMALLGGMLLLGLVVAPRLLGRVARLRSRELFVLAVFGMVVGTASTAVALGLSVALGAFVAGIVVGESEYSQQALADVVPMRDIFASFFFVSLGMYTDFGFIVQNLGLIALALATVVVVGSGLPALTTLAFGYPLRPALLVASGALPLGEFNFVLARTAIDAGLADESVLGLIMGTALVTLVAAPAANQGADLLYRWLAARKMAGVEPAPISPAVDEVLQGPRHAVICGFGRTGQTIADLLTRRRIPCMVVDLDPRSVGRAREMGLPCVYGDISSPEVLERCRLDRARVLVIAISDPLVVDMAVRHTLTIAPRLDIVARVARGTHLQVPDTARIELVEPSFEAGLEIVRHTLLRFGLTSQEVQLIVSSLRQQREP